MYYNTAIRVFQERFYFTDDLSFDLTTHSNHARLLTSPDFQPNQRKDFPMFKKLFIAMLILGFVGTVSVTAQEVKIPTIEKADLSSKRATTRTFILAALNNKPEILLECYSPQIITLLNDIAKQKKVSLTDMISKACPNIQKEFKQKIEKEYKGDLEKMIDAAVKEALFINIDGKWYFHMK